MRVVALAAAASLLAGCAVSGTKTTTETTTVAVTRTVTAQATPGKGALAETENARYFGTISSISRVGSHQYLLVLKPEFFLVGVTANVLFNAEQQNACRPLRCSSPPDDRYVVPAGARSLTFVLPRKIEGSVLTIRHGQMQNTTVSGTDLAVIVDGFVSLGLPPTTTPKLIEPLDSGLWLTVDADTVRSFAQQFQP